MQNNWTIHSGSLSLQYALGLLETVKTVDGIKRHLHQEVKECDTLIQQYTLK